MLKFTNKLFLESPQISECIFGMEVEHINPCAAIKTKQVNKTRCQELCDDNHSCNSWTFKVTKNLEVCVCTTTQNYYFNRWGGLFGQKVNS